MNNSLTILLLILGVFVVGFFLMNNIMHTGFHVGHVDGDNHEELGMMGMMDDHDEEDGHHNENKENDDHVEDHEIYPGDVAEKIENKEDIILLDVRNPEEYTEIHLENALLLPVGELSFNTLAGIGLGEGAKDKEIIIYCRSGARSKQAYDVMKSLGYTNIKSVAGGMVHWQEDNYPFTEVGDYITEKITQLDIGGGAKISFDKTFYDFGNIPQSQGTISTTFEVKNTGDSTLEIGELSTSCGCTTAEISENSIEPDETAILTVYFDPDFHKEPADQLTRTVFIPTNDSATPEAEVKITVDILEGQ
jgi:rhodanese-related sulfurtransferase